MSPCRHAGAGSGRARGDEVRFFGRDGTIKLCLSENAKRPLIAFDVDNEGLSKAGVNGLIDAQERSGQDGALARRKQLASDRCR
jgi:hypothetical protein